MFDVYLVVDWSASSRPKAGSDSIWIGVQLAAGADAVTFNPATRRSAEALLRELLHELAAAGKRVLVGLDFPFGYPAGFTRALFPDAPTWKSVWSWLASQVKDAHDNANNRFPVAADINCRLGRHVFWGCPASQHYEHLSSRRDIVCYRSMSSSGGIGEWRQVEALLRSHGRFPQSVWKLLGAGSVGSQSLTGIPVLQRLRQDKELERLIYVWPFEELPETRRGRPLIVFCEVWPSMYDSPRLSSQVKDESQVIAFGDLVRREGADGRLRGLLDAGNIPLAAEEGWILGVRTAGAGALSGCAAACDDG